jgi:hypothetical protein
MEDFDKPVHPMDEKRLKTRGIGSGRNYEPFIKVHEISSTGESYRILGRHSSRPHHLLSRVELSAFLVFDRYSQTVDIKEQFPIPILDSLNICRNLGIRHPQIANNLKVVTTDLVVELVGGSYLAIAVKPSDSLDDQRVVEKLQIEKVYWEHQGCQWKLFTEKEISPSTKENLEWIQAAHKGNDALYSELSYQDLSYVFHRVSGIKNNLSVTCATLDDEYDCPKGFHIGVIRKAVACNVLDGPLDVVFHKWSCSDLSLVSKEALIDEVPDVS